MHCASRRHGAQPYSESLGRGNCRADGSRPAIKLMPGGDADVERTYAAATIHLAVVSGRRKVAVERIRSDSGERGDMIIGNRSRQASDEP